MNCKPGDIARIVHPKAYGVLVSILYQEPDGYHTLPDGVLAMKNAEGPSWVFEFLGGRQSVPYGNSREMTTRQARYAACLDKWLRPIRDNDGEDETLTWAGKPEAVPA